MKTNTAHAATTKGCPIHQLLQIPRNDAGAARVDAAGIAIFAFGVAAYALFFGVFVYAALFVGNWFVPKSIDSGTPAPLGEALLVNVGILSLFVLQHTVMARRWFKNWFTGFVSQAVERSVYVVAASLILALLFWQWRPLPQVIWDIRAPALWWALTGLSVFGYLLTLSSSFMVSHADLFGLRQVFFRLLGRQYQPVGFRLTGLYKLVRHPLMVGFLIAFWSTPTMTVGHLLFASLSTAYIFFGTWIEERDLIAHHGEAYLAYRRTVPGFVPLPRFGEA